MPADRKHRGRSGFRGQGGCDICHRKHRSLYFQQPHQSFFFCHQRWSVSCTNLRSESPSKSYFLAHPHKGKDPRRFCKCRRQLCLEEWCPKLHDKLVHQSPRNVLDKKLFAWPPTLRLKTSAREPGTRDSHLVFI